MVHFVGAGPGAPDLITLRGAELLRCADCIIYAGSLVNPSLLAWAKDGCTSAEMTLEQVLAVIEMQEREHHDTVRLHTGDASIYGAIREQMDALERRGISALREAIVDMFTTVFVGSNTTVREGDWMITPRGYRKP